MYVTCLDLEGVLVPEIWIAFAEASGIPELKKTTRDEPDYNKLMNYRLAMRYYQIAERMFYDRLATGDFYIKSNYDKVIARQAEIRNRLEAQLPKYNWTE